MFGSKERWAGKVSVRKENLQLAAQSAEVKGVERARLDEDSELESGASFQTAIGIFVTHKPAALHHVHVLAQQPIGQLRPIPRNAVNRSGFAL